MRGGEEIKAHEREMLRRRRADPVKRAHDLAVKKAWRERNVVRLKLQKRKWRLNPDRPNGYSSREKYEAYHRRYRAEHGEHRRMLARRRYAELHPNRPHPICACGCAQPIPWNGNGRPAKWLREHRPYPQSPTPKEILMTAAGRAIAVLERAADRIRKKLEGTQALQQELAAIERAMKELRTVPGADEAQPKRRKKAA